MQNRSQRVLRRVGVGLLGIVVVLLMILEDVLSFAGFLVRKILPADFEEFLRSRSNAFAFCFVGIALMIWLVVHVIEWGLLWYGYWWSAVALGLVSKIYFVAVLGYLCRVYSDRLLAVEWIKRSWKWYLASKEWLKSFELYQIIHAYYVRVKDQAKVLIRRVRERLKARPGSLFSKVWRLIRRKYHA